MRGTLFFAILFVTLSTAVASLQPESLNDSDRSGLRYRLENLFNEVDLIVRNHRTDELDLVRQSQTIQGLKIYERIPFQARTEEIREQLSDSAEENGFKIRAFKLLGVNHGQDIPPVPTELYTDQKGFQLSPEQIAEPIRFRVTVEGDKERIRTSVRDGPRTSCDSWNPKAALARRFFSRLEADAGKLKPGRFATETCASPDLKSAIR